MSAPPLPAPRGSQLEAVLAAVREPLRDVVRTELAIAAHVSPRTTTAVALLALAEALTAAPREEGPLALDLSALRIYNPSRGRHRGGPRGP